MIPLIKQNTNSVPLRTLQRNKSHGRRSFFNHPHPLSLEVQSWPL